MYDQFILKYMYLFDLFKYCPSQKNNANALQINFDLKNKQKLITSHVTCVNLPKT